jgi:hypothetical protein
MKVEDVDLENLRYKAVIRKGRNYVEKWRPIKRIVLHLWEELIKEAEPNSYLFSRHLKPGKDQIKAYQITKRWSRLILKKDLGITASFYSLKHSNLTEVSALLGAKAAASNAGHAGTGMIVNIYDTEYGNRQMDAVKDVGNKF